MKEFYIIFGLPGSGKTTYAKSILESGDLFLDDISVLSKNEKIEKFIRLSGISNKKINKIIITDPMLCLKENQNKLINILGQENEIKINWIFMKSDVKRCIERCSHDAKNTIYLLKDKINLDLDNLTVIPENWFKENKNKDLKWKMKKN